MCAFTQKNTVCSTNYLMIFLGKFLCRNFSTRWDLQEENLPFEVPKGKYRSKGSDLVRCEKVAAHRERILFQLYFSTALRNVGRKSFSNRNFPESGIVTRVLFWKYWARQYLVMCAFTQKILSIQPIFSQFPGQIPVQEFFNQERWKSIPSSYTENSCIRVPQFYLLDSPK